MIGKYSIVCYGNDRSIRRMETELERIGYIRSNANNPYSGPKISLGTGNSPGANYKCNEFGSWTISTDEGKYNFRIENENEFQTALAIASMHDDNIPHVGEWVTSGPETVTGKQGTLHRISKVCSRNLDFGTEDYTGGEWATSGFDYNTKSTPEEIIQHFKNKKMSEKKIIGYKAPMNFSAYSLKKGDVFTPHSQGVYTNNLFLPAEIVEKWEPVYEAEEIVLTIGNPEKVLTIKRGQIKSDNGTFSGEYIKEILNAFTIIQSIYAWGVKVTKVWIGCEHDGTEVTREEVQEVLTAYEKVNS